MKLSTHLTFAIIPVIFFLVAVPNAFALTISPVKVEVTGEPGQTLRGELELLNEQLGAKTFFSSFENFEPSGDTGSPKFVGGDEGLAMWLKTETSVSVSTGETIKVPYTITIPSDVEPGGYFAAIFWGEQDPSIQEAGEVAIGGKLGVLILLRVSGDIIEKAGISDFSISEGKNFRTGLPITFSYRFSNSGGDRVVPLGDISIQNMLGMETVTISANINEGSVLPNSARKFQAIWGKVSTSSVGFIQSAKQQLTDFHFGPYRAELGVVYGVTNQAVTDSFWFFIFPWQLLTLLGVAFILGVLALRKYNSWIISKSKSKA